MPKNYPFELFDAEGEHHIVAYIEDPALYPTYYDLFGKHGYEGNGYCWEGHIRQILEKIDRELLEHLEFDSEAGMFAATADNKQNQLKFAETLSPILSDLILFQKWIVTADRSRIDD